MPRAPCPRSRAPRGAGRCSPTGTRSARAAAARGAAAREPGAARARRAAVGTGSASRGRPGTRGRPPRAAAPGGRSRSRARRTSRASPRPHATPARATAGSRVGERRGPECRNFSRGRRRVALRHAATSALLPAFRTGGGRSRRSTGGRRRRSSGGEVRVLGGQPMPKCSRRASFAAHHPFMPCTAGPGGVALEQRYTPGTGVRHGAVDTTGRFTNWARVSSPE